MRAFAISRQCIIMLILILQLVLVANSWSMKSNFGEMPDYCHAMSSKFLLLKDPGSIYKGVIDNSSVDIVCVGDDLVIDHDIYSNGGDIIIFAGDLQLNAPLDSRLYYAPSGIESYIDGGNNEYGYPTRSVSEALKFEPTYKQSFEAYYTYCVDCRNEKGKVLLIPELPHGLTPDVADTWDPPYLRFMKAGLPPPDNSINFEKVRSGNIYIIANSLKVKDELKTPQILSEIPACPNGTLSPPTNFVRYAINAGGVRGGRGGAGVPSLCTKANPYGRGCIDAPAMTSAGTGPGGRGGDAGMVFIGIISPQGVTDELQGIVSGITNVKGGAPGPSTQWLGPTSLGTFQATGSVCDFYRRPVGGNSWPPAAPGKDETIIFKRFTRSESLAYLSALIGPKDASLDYDLPELAGRAYLSSSIRNVSFDGYLVSKIYDSLAQAQVKVVADINQVFQGRKESDTRYVRPPFEDIKLDVLETSMLSKKSLIFLRELNTYDQKVDRESPLIHYLINSGGLFNLGNVKPFDRFLSEATRTDISRLEVPLDKIVATLGELQREATELHLGIKTKEMQATLSRLTVLLQDAENRAREMSQQKPWLQRIVTSLGEAVAAIVVVYGEYASGNSEGLKASLPLAWDKMGNFRDVYVDRFEQVSMEVPDLKEALEKAEAAYSLFVKESADIRQTLLEERHSALLELLNDRSSHYSKLQNRLAQFHDLLRLSTIGLLLDPSKNREVFINNLQSIVTFVEEFPISEPYFRFRDVINYCLRDPGLFDRWGQSDECIYAKPSKEWNVVWSPLGYEKDKKIRVPLYVVAPSTTSYFLPTYGMEYSLEKIAPPMISEISPVLHLTPRLSIR